MSSNRRHLILHALSPVPLYRTGARPRQPVRPHGTNRRAIVCCVTAQDRPGHLDPDVDHNRAVWEKASQKHIREYDDLLRQASGHTSLLDRERTVLAPLLATDPTVVHLQSGHGLDDVDLVAAGARRVIGVDYSTVAAGAAQRRAVELGLACHYVVAALPGAPLPAGCADLVYTGKGALIWHPDISAWAADAARLLKPGAHLYVYEGHPTVPLWTWDEDEPRIRPDRGYFARSTVNDTFPAGGAIEWQWTLGAIVTAVIEAGLELRHLAEYPEPAVSRGRTPAQTKPAPPW
jgi:SAM-dependent methyltransferase